MGLPKGIADGMGDARDMTDMKEMEQELTRHDVQPMRSATKRSSKKYHMLPINDVSTKFHQP